jgi:hypothetical protein
MNAGTERKSIALATELRSGQGKTEIQVLQDMALKSM